LDQGKNSFFSWLANISLMTLSPLYPLCRDRKFNALGMAWPSLAERAARFGFPEVRIGFVPAMVMAVLRRSVGEKKGFELITTIDEISADEAERLGLANRVFDDQTFEREVENFVRKFEKSSRSAVGLSKRLLYQIDGLALNEALSAGADINTIARMTEDCQKGIARFLTKE